MWMCNYSESGQPAVDRMRASGGKDCFAPSAAALPFCADLFSYTAILLFFIRQRSITHSNPGSTSRNPEATLKLKSNGKFTLLGFPGQPRRKFFTTDKEVLSWL